MVRVRLISIVNGERVEHGEATVEEKGDRLLLTAEFDPETTPAELYMAVRRGRFQIAAVQD